MNRIELRKKMITEKYKIEDYEGTKKNLEDVYKKQVAEKLVEHLIKNDKQLSSLGVDEKNQIVKDILTEKGAEKLEVINDGNSTSFSFYTKSKDAKNPDPIRVILILRDGQEEQAA